MSYGSPTFDMAYGRLPWQQPPKGDAVKPWKRDLAYIREVGPDEPRFDEAVKRVWDQFEELEKDLKWWQRECKKMQAN